MILLIKRNSMIPLYLYTHIIFNNIKILMDVNCHKINNNNGSGNSVGGSGGNHNMLLIPQLHLHYTAYINSVNYSVSSSTSYTSQYGQLVIL
jgi:hypothetical protein